MGNSPKESWSGAGVRPSLLFVLNIDREVSYCVAVLALPEQGAGKPSVSNSLTRLASKTLISHCAETDFAI